VVWVWVGGIGWVGNSSVWVWVCVFVCSLVVGCVKVYTMRVEVYASFPRPLLRSS